MVFSNKTKVTPIESQTGLVHLFSYFEENPCTLTEKVVLSSVYIAKAEKVTCPKCPQAKHGSVLS